MLVLIIAALNAFMLALAVNCLSDLVGILKLDRSSLAFIRYKADKRRYGSKYKSDIPLLIIAVAITITLVTPVWGAGVLAAAMSAFYMVSESNKRKALLDHTLEDSFDIEETAGDGLVAHHK